jgi:transposase
MSAHQVCLLNKGKHPLQRSFPHSSAGLQALISWLVEHSSCEPAALFAAIEVPHGPVIAVLLDAGFSVFAINPKQLDRFRDRFSPAGAKDDRRDAFVLAQSLSTDEPAFTRVVPLDDDAIALRAASRRRDFFQDELRGHCNRLLQELWSAYPELLALCPAADEPWLWDLLERLSQPVPRIPGRVALANLLKRHRKRNVTTAMLVDALAVSPAASGALLRAILDDIAWLLPLLRAAHAGRRAADSQLRELVLAAGAVAEIVDSMPGVDITLTAVFLAEAPGALAAGDYQALRALCGTAPVTVQSGKSHSVRIRRACNHRLRNAVRHWARTAARVAPWAKTQYTAMRERGKSHERALRSIADHFLCRLAACLRTNTRYDPVLAARRMPVQSPDASSTAIP